MWRKRYYQWCPMIFGSLTSIVAVVMFHLKKDFFDATDEEILTSTTLQSICDYPFKYSLLISTGVLIPFMIDEVYGWVNGLLPSSIDSYLLPILVVIMQFFNIYWLSQGSTVEYFWDYHMGVRIEMLVLYNIVLALQINLVHHSTTVLHALGIATMSFNCGMICKICSLGGNSPMVSYCCLILWGICWLCNLYIAYSWLNLYRTAKQQSLAYMEHFYAFVMILILVILYLVNTILSSVKLAFSFEDMTSTGLVLQQILLLCSFYSVIELNALLLKHEARSSIDALETKRLFVRYVSHEIRTPLNAACLGLQLLDQEIRNQYSPNELPLATNSKEMRRLSSLSSNSSKKESMLDLITDITQACNITMDIVNDLLMYEKIDGGLMALETQETLLIPFVEEVLKLFSVQAKTSNVELILRNNAQQDNIVVKVDRNKMSQVIRNLISNALKFSPVGSKVEIDVNVFDNNKNKLNDHSNPWSLLYNVAHHCEDSGPTDIEHGSKPIVGESILSANKSLPLPNFWPSSPRVHDSNAHDNLFITSFSSLSPPATSLGVGGAHCDPIVRISVKDCGVGITKENQKRLFREIVQFDAAKLQQGKGSGIGLWVSNKIMKLHGGIIHVFSEGEGHGSTFSINMPVTRSSTIAPSVPICIKPIVSFQKLLLHQRSSSRSNESNISKIGEGILDIVSGKLSTNKVKPSIVIATNGQEETDHDDVGRNSLTLKESFHITTDITNKASIHNHQKNTVVSQMLHVEQHEAKMPKLQTPEKQTKTVVHVKRVLIVDDSQVNRKMLKNVLRKKFDEFEEAEDGEDALARYHSHSHGHDANQHSNYYDVIITDYLMPRMNGVELVKQLRSNGYTGQIIGLTGDTDMQVAFEEAGANHLLIKPVQGKVLLETVQGCC